MLSAGSFPKAEKSEKTLLGDAGYEANTQQHRWPGVLDAGRLHPRHLVCAGPSRAAAAAASNARRGCRQDREAEGVPGCDGGGAERVHAGLRLGLELE